MALDRRRAPRRRARRGSSGTRSIAWWYCSRISPRAFMPGRPRDDARVARAAVELVALPHLERRVERHRPAVRVVVVGLRAAELVEQRQVGLDGCRGCRCMNFISLTEPLGPPSPDAPLSETRTTRVFSRQPELLEEAEQAADLVVGVREEPGVDLGHPAEESLLLVRERVPRAGDVESGERLAVRAGAGLGRADRVDRRQLRVRRDEPELLLAGEGLLAHRLVADVESALVLVDPLLRRVVRRVARARARSRGRTASPARSTFASRMNSIALSVRSTVRW